MGKPKVEGEAFIPFQAFSKVVVTPLGLLAAKHVSPMAKNVYALLSRFAGTNGECFPSMETIANGVGCSTRHAKNLVKELIDAGLLRSKRGGSGKSNRYVFPWRDWLETPEVNSESPKKGTTVPVCRGTTDPPNRVIEGIDSTDLDLDYPLRGHISKAGSSEEFEALRSLVGNMLQRKPSEKCLLRIIDAAPNKLVSEAVEAIESANFRGYGAGSKHAPDCCKWFESTVGDHFHRKAQRFSPPIAKAITMNDEEFDRLSQAFDCEVIQ